MIKRFAIVHNNLERHSPSAALRIFIEVQNLFKYLFKTCLILCYQCYKQEYKRGTLMF